MAGVHTDFWEVTCNGLDFALEALGLQDNPALRDRLLHLYWELQAYPEVSQMLQDLKAGEVKTALQICLMVQSDPQVLRILSMPSYRLKKLGYLSHTKAFIN